MVVSTGVSADDPPTAVQADDSDTNQVCIGLKRTLDRLDRVLGVVFIGVVLLNFASAASRYVAGRPIVGGDEVQVYVMVWLVFLGAAMAAMRRAHLRMDVLTMDLRPVAAWWRMLAEMLTLLLTCGSMVVVSLQFTLQIYGMDQHSEAAGIPMWLPHLSVAAGFFGLALCALLELRQLVRRRP